MHPLSRRFAAVVLLCGVAFPVSAHAGQQFVTGVFTATESGAPMELIAWAESNRGGPLSMANGALDDAPVLPRTYRFLVNTGIYTPVAVIATTGEVFAKGLDFLERKTLAYSATKLGVSTYEIGVPELEDWSKVQRLGKSLKASDRHPLIFFIVITNGTVVRYYPFFINQ